MRNALNVPNTRCMGGLRKYEMAICTDFLGNQNGLEPGSPGLYSTNFIRYQNYLLCVWLEVVIIA